MMKNRLGIILITACLLLTFNGSTTNAQATFWNKTELQMAKLAFPDASFVDLTRKVTITVEKSDEADQPFYWRVTEESERISVSNQRFFTFSVFLHDFIKQDKVILAVKKDKTKELVRPEPRVQMWEEDGLFHTNYKVKYYSQHISRPGEILSIYSTYLVTSYAHLNDISFGSAIPAISSEIQIEVPRNMTIRLDSLNFDQANISLDVKSDKKKSTYLYKQSLVSASKGVGNAPNQIYYQPHVLLFAEKMTDNAGKEIQLMADVKDVYRWSTNMVRKTENKPDSIRHLVDSLTAGLSEEAKLKKLYYWVQDNIRYLAFEDGLAAFVPDACQNVYYKRFGDCKGKANLLKEMLVMSGFDARLVWIGTRDFSFLEVTQPTIGTCNHMITAVKWKDQWLFLDPTTSYYGLNQIPDQLQGKTALIEGDGEPLIVTVPTTSEVAQYNSSSLRLQLSPNKQEFEGRQHREIAGNDASSIRTMMFRTAGKDQKELKKQLLTYNNLNVGYNDENFEIDENRDTPVRYSSGIRVSNSVMELEDQLLFPATIFPVLKGNRIHPDRRAALSFGEKMNQNDTLIYDIPAGYEVEYLPESLNVKRGKYSFLADVTQIGNKIQVVCQVKMTDFILFKKEFEQWNKDHDALTAFTKNRIVLQKKKP